jgi:hypothetical protein
MNCSVKIIVSWVMILNLTLGFMPVSSALDLDSNHHAASCDLMLFDSIDRYQNGSLEKTDLIGCQDFSVCAMHYSCAPLHSSSVLTVTPQTLVHRTISIDDVRVLTRYLGIPRRPPRT